VRTFSLVRVGFNDDGTYGVLRDELGDPLFVTLEESWRNNEKNKSCIPPGGYDVMRVRTPKHGETWQVMNVEGRSAILIHVINTEADTEGCIGLGKEYGKLRAKDDQSGEMEWQPAIRRSGEAIAEFNEMLKGENEFRLKVVW
jgi:hypothetical protein